MFKFFNRLQEKEPRKSYNVGSSVAEAFVNAQITVPITITRKGYVMGLCHRESTNVLRGIMEENWILADDGIYYNRNFILEYKVRTKSYFVYDDNTPVLGQDLNEPLGND